ncbi:GNAT family N-acetyltransferase [Oceanobacillus piezotolerans]|uniref:GNAT family N-acetyltransferase n=1 Tax=Oceanobacillus piezotolerans TaxID=2448030 RepID=UPI0013148A5F|nr:GNAT family N-acetyltransferase [Oceanobacillus piezotolerans]
MLIRRFDIKDAKQILKLFRETVLTVNLGDYSEKQVEVWANSTTNAEALGKRLEESFTYVAVIDKQIVGFVNLNNKGEVDLLYIHKNYQRQGIATKLLAQIEKVAKSKGLSEMFTEASITAKPFFELQGYKVLKKQTKNLKGTDFINFIMKKNIR